MQSSDIIRMFYTEFDGILPDKYKSVDLFPEGLRAEIEGTNDWTYNDINNGVYKSGFATYARFLLTRLNLLKALSTSLRSLEHKKLMGKPWNLYSSPLTAPKPTLPSMLHHTILVPTSLKQTSASIQPSFALTQSMCSISSAISVI